MPLRLPIAYRQLRYLRTTRGRVPATVNRPGGGRAATQSPQGQSGPPSQVETQSDHTPPAEARRFPRCRSAAMWTLYKVRDKVHDHLVGRAAEHLADQLFGPEVASAFAWLVRKGKELSRGLWEVFGEDGQNKK